LCWFLMLLYVQSCLQSGWASARASNVWNRVLSLPYWTILSMLQSSKLMAEVTVSQHQQVIFNWWFT
jgi:hypothetical protein